MWRVFKDIPRAFRQSYNSLRSSPSGASRRDEDKAADDAQASSSNPLISDHSPYVAHFVRENSKPLTSEQRGERDRKEWRSHFEQWTSWRQQKCIADMIGWSAAVALCLHLSRTVHPLKKGRWDGDKHGISPTLSAVYRVALSMPQGSLSLSILPRVPAEKSQQSTSDATTASNESPGSKESHLLLRKAWVEFENVVSLYKNTTCSVAGLAHARQGDYSLAIKHWQMASEHGHTKSQYNLGLCYELGKGAKKDLAKAIDLYMTASANGHGRASYNLARIFLDEACNEQHDPSRVHSLMKLASKSGIPQAMTYMGVYYLGKENRDFVQAVVFFTKAAKMKDLEAIFCLGVCYENGWGVAADESKAVELYTLAARAGHSGALFNVAVFYEQGLGGLRACSQTALEYYRQAENSGNQDAAFNRKRLEAITTLEDLTEYHTDQSANLPGADDSTRRLIQSVSSSSLDTLRSSSSSPTLSDLAKEHFNDFQSNLDRSRASSNGNLTTGSPLRPLDLESEPRAKFTSRAASESDTDDDFEICFEDEVPDEGHPWFALTRCSYNTPCVSCT